jgi:hypothetical protein
VVVCKSSHRTLGCGKVGSSLSGDQGGRSTKAARRQAKRRDRLGILKSRHSPDVVTDAADDLHLRQRVAS